MTWSILIYEFNSYGTRCMDGACLEGILLVRGTINKTPFCRDLSLSTASAQTQTIDW